MKEKLAFDLGVRKMKLKHRMKIAWRILFGKANVFQINEQLFYRNHDKKVTEIEL